uniref:CAMPATH-1 antigen n=1 Tax=Myotis myotis TaxID=51298 RepID=A0A7J7ZT77_MYOMY|nr:CD52 molecule [Myotis myotis]
MKGFYFLLFTISFLIMIQANQGRRGATTTTFGTKKIKGGAPALSSLGSGGVLIFLTNTLLQLLHLS